MCVIFVMLWEWIQNMTGIEKRTTTHSNALIKTSTGS